MTIPAERCGGWRPARAGLAESGGRLKRKLGAQEHPPWRTNDFPKMKTQDHLGCSKKHGSCLLETPPPLGSGQAFCGAGAAQRKSRNRRFPMVVPPVWYSCAVPWYIGNEKEQLKAGFGRKCAHHTRSAKVFLPLHFGGAKVYNENQSFESRADSNPARIRILSVIYSLR